MTIDRAVEILTSDKREVLISSIAELREAQQMGIEALSYINICRHNPNCFRISLLPGETEEVK